MMSKTTQPRTNQTTSNPPLGFRFGVMFSAGGKEAKPVDTLFQKVSGLSSSVETGNVSEGGQNLYLQTLPKRIKYDNLVLERGLVLDSALAGEFHNTMARFKFSLCNVLVTLLDTSGAPLMGWNFLNAFPLKWSVTDLDANANTVVIERLELSYQNMLVTRL